MHRVRKVFAGTSKVVNFTAFFFSTIETRVLQQRTAVISPQLWQSKRRGVSKIAFSIFGSFRGSREAFSGKGSTRPTPTLQLHFSFWGSTFRSRGLRFVDINPRCPAAFRENWKTPFGVVGYCRCLCEVDFYLHVYICHFTLAYAHVVVFLKGDSLCLHAPAPNHLRQ